LISQIEHFHYFSCNYPIDFWFHIQSDFGLNRKMIESRLIMDTDRGGGRGSDKGPPGQFKKHITLVYPLWNFDQKKTKEHPRVLEKTWAIHSLDLWTVCIYSSDPNAYELFLHFFISKKVFLVDEASTDVLTTYN
jgi:hypothetical protein